MGASVKRVEQLLAQRRQDLNKGIESDAQNVRKTLSELKTITDQFELIYANVTDQVKVLQRIKQPQPAKEEKIEMVREA